LEESDKKITESGRFFSVFYKMRILCGKFLNGCLGVFNWCEKGDFGWECVEMRDFERLFLSVGWVRRVDFAANSALLCSF
jgi:hypothetical protein